MSISSLRWGAASALSVAVTAVLALAVTGAAAAPAMARTPAATSPTPVPANAQLSGVSADSASDAWAAGYYVSNRTHKTLILHWNGTAWSQVPSPSPSSNSNQLSGVSAVSGSDAWAVGYYNNTTTGATDTLILHWNGTAWTQVPSPSPSTDASELFGVSAISPSNAWAVGFYVDTAANADKALILHWNGATWSQVTSPSPGTEGPTSVSADSGSDAWVAGDSTVGTMTLHWNGIAWSQVPSPNPSSQVNRLSGVSAISPSNAWAVGYFDQTHKVLDETLVLHWNGTTWTRVFSPSPGTDGNELSGVSAVSASSAWAVGRYNSRISGVNVGKALILHWNGKAWVKAASPAPGTGSLLTGASAVSASNAWAVGYSFSNNVNVTHPLILHWNGSTWTRS